MTTEDANPLGQPLPPFPDPREAWASPYRGLEFGLSLKWLCGGALLYALLLLVAMAGKPDDATIPILGPSLYLTPMYGLPYVLATLNRPGRTRRMLFFIILLPLIHIAANYLAWSYAVANFEPYDTEGDWQRGLITGGIGGLAGSVLSFALLRLVQLTPRERTRPLVMVLGVLLLTALGAAGMTLGLQWSGALHDLRHEPGRQIIWYETVHFPWQLGFSFLLAWLMRKPPEPSKRILPIENFEMHEATATG